jgi:hypothetical protein
MRRAPLVVLAGLAAAITARAAAQDKPPSGEDIVPSGAATQPRALPSGTQPVVVAPPPTATPRPTATAPPTATPAPDENIDKYYPSVKLEAGYSLRKLDDFGVSGLDLRGGVGAENKYIGHYFSLGFLYGSTSQSLRTYSLMGGYNLDFRISIVRVGAGVEFGYLWVRRASVDARMFALGIGAYGHGGVDIVQFGPGERFGLYVDGRIQGSVHYTNALLWGPSIVVGVRF